MPSEFSLAPMAEPLSMPSLGSGSDNPPSSQPKPNAGSSTGADVDVHALVATSMQAQTEDFSGAAQLKINSNVVQLVQTTMGTALGALDDQVKSVAADVSKVADRVDGLSNKLDTFDATQKKILLQLEKLEIASEGNAASSFMSGNNSNGQPKPPTASPGVETDGAGVGTHLLSSEGFFRSPDPCLLTPMNPLKFLSASSTSPLLNWLQKLIWGSKHLRCQVKSLMTGSRYSSFVTSHPCCQTILFQSPTGKGCLEKASGHGSHGICGQVLYFPRKNLAQVRKEVLAKSLQSVLKPLVAKEVWVKKQTGSILVERRKLVSPIFVAEYDARLEWNHIRAADLKLDVALIEFLFKSEFLLGAGRQSS